MTKVEQFRGRFAQCQRAVHSGSEMDVAPPVVAQIELGKSWLVAARKCDLRAAPVLQLGKRELDVLAGAELARGIIGA
jgi:hypothetical protein